MPEPKKMDSTWLVIVNPHAGSKKCEHDWPKIHKLLEDSGLNTHCLFTDYPNHAMHLVIQNIEAKGFKKIIVVGGDGTLNEVINGIFRQKKFRPSDITTGMITVGTGNDWGRMYKMQESYKKQVKMLIKGHTILQDVGQVKYRFVNEGEHRYFVNIAGMGYDAMVTEKTNVMKQKGKGGVLIYLINLISGLFRYKSVYLDINSDGKRIFSGKVFTLSIGICKYNGGGMMQLPYAIPDDGLFDLTIIRKTTKFRIVTNIKNLFDGSFVKMPEVQQFKGEKITITSRPQNKLYLETDGESLGHSPLEFKIIPKAARLIVRKKFASKSN